jgi:hypothetical protein
VANFLTVLQTLVAKNKTTGTTFPRPFGRNAERSLHLSLALASRAQIQHLDYRRERHGKINVPSVDVLPEPVG